ncbi:MAG: PIN domain-containing protein [Peptoanaerobacter stomatis]|uniref:PIN domain-containing protein n=1 Tax=Peptoanaerobacter stomatis TaxID=796937 RepID=UPI003FA112DC
MHYIILDTNIFFDNFFIESFYFSNLLKLNQDEDFRIVIPEFIFEEIIKKYGDAISNTFKIITELSKDNKKYRITNFDFDSIKKGKTIDEYRKNFKKLLDDNYILVIDYPKDEKIISEISKRYFLNQKPFAKDKNSFQDAIIWYSILDIIKNSSDLSALHFISNNYKDFAKDKNNKEVFSEELDKELKKLTDKKTYLYNSIQSFLEKRKDDLDKIINKERKKEEAILNEKVEKYAFEYFNNLKYIDESKILEESIINSNELDDFVQESLSEGWFKGDWLEGWGDEGYFDTKEIEIKEIEGIFISDFEGRFEFIINLDVFHNIFDINPMYEDSNDSEYIYERDINTNFEIKISVEFYINDEIKGIEIDDVEKEIEEYIEITDVNFENY